VHSLTLVSRPNGADRKRRPKASDGVIHSGPTERIRVCAPAAKVPRLLPLAALLDPSAPTWIEWLQLEVSSSATFENVDGQPLRMRLMEDVRLQCTEDDS